MRSWLHSSEKLIWGFKMQRGLIERGCRIAVKEFTMQRKHCKIACCGIWHSWLGLNNSMIDYSKCVKTNKRTLINTRSNRSRLIKQSDWGKNKKRKKEKKKRSAHFPYYPGLSLWNSPHSLQVQPAALEARGDATYPVEKDEGDALFKVWAHEPLKGLFMPLLAWIITPRSLVMCCGWYIGPHLLPLRFHLARSSKSPINKKGRACTRIAASAATLQAQIYR